MYLANIDRFGLLNYLPPRAIVAEIGTKRGVFAKQIMITTHPKKLHLIDPWGFEDDDPYLALNRQSTSESQAMLEKVKVRFEKKIKAGKVEIHRTYGIEAAGHFPKNYFDWIYIDAMKDYTSVIENLEAFDDKVKIDGFICGDDFANFTKAKRQDYEVVAAVESFVAQRGYKIVLITNEAYPSYVIVKDDKASRVQELIHEILGNVDMVVEIQERGVKFQQKSVIIQGNLRPEIAGYRGVEGVRVFPSIIREAN